MSFVVVNNLFSCFFMFFLVSFFLSLFFSLDFSPSGTEKTRNNLKIQFRIQISIFKLWKVGRGRKGALGQKVGATVERGKEGRPGC